MEDRGTAEKASSYRYSVLTFLSLYGFEIPLAKGVVAEADDAIAKSGSFYAYGRGGSVTIVDPIRGKVQLCRLTCRIPLSNAEWEVLGIYHIIGAIISNFIKCQV